MEDVLSAPRGLCEWRSKRPSLDFLTLDSDKGTMFPPNNSGQTGLDMVNIDQDNGLGSRKDFLQEGDANMDNLLRSAGYFCTEDIIQLQGVSHPTPSHCPIREKPEEAEDIGDTSLSWLFGPGSPDLLWGSSLEGLGLPQEESVQEQTSQGPEGDLISISVPSSPEQKAHRTSERSSHTSTLLVDLLSEEIPFSSDTLLTPRCFGEDNPQGVTQGSPGAEEGGASQSPESGAPPTAGNETPQSSPDTFHTHSASTSQDLSDRALPLLDSEIPDGCQGNGNLSPTALSSLTCPVEQLDSPKATPEGGHPAPAPAATHLTSCGAGEPESPSLGTATSTLQPSETPPSNDEDLEAAELPGDPAPQEVACGAGVMERQVSSAHEGMAAAERENLGSNVEEQPCQASDAAATSSALNLTAGADDAAEPTTTILNQAGPEPDSSGSSSPEPPEWTSGKSYKDKTSLSKMVVPDSLPVDSTVTQKEESVSPLKAVFDALDQDGDGFVRIEEFMEFAAAYGAEQVKDLTRFLDPSGLGVISFEDFHRGISTIGNGGPEPQLYDAHYSPGDGAGGCQEEYDEQNEVTDSAYLGSESTYSECETFTDEDTGALLPPEMHEEVETDSGIEAPLHDADDSANRFSLNTELQDLSLVTVMGGGEEEHFEDFGEDQGAELLEGGGVEEEQEEGPAEGGGGDGGPGTLNTPEQINGSALIMSLSTPAPLSDCIRSFLREEAQDFFCSQCHKQINRLEDLSTRLNFLEMTSSGKRLSSKKVARHLLQNSSMTLDTMSDLTRDILELADNDITDKVLLLERRVAELEKESETSGEVRARLRQENLQLVHRANALEEQLKEQELYAQECLEQEERRHKEALSKMEREMGLELENLQARLQQLDEENSELRSCVPCLRANIERLEEEKMRSQDELEEVTERLSEEQEVRRKMADKLSHERHLGHKEKESMQELIEDLRKQLEHLQLYKLEAEGRRGRSASAGLQEYHTRTREAELEHEVKRLKQDNRSLKEQNDELNGQIINLSIQGAKNLMTAPFSDSLAAEINSVSRGELMEAVHKQEEINYRLQDYIDKIIVAIMECNPSILEVK